MKNSTKDTAPTSTEILTKELRPRRLSQVFGQDSIVKALRAQMKKKTPALLFYGGSGCGKTTLARIVAHSVQCTHQKEFGETCDACLAVKDFTVHELNASDLTGKDDAGNFAEMASYRPMPPSRFRVLIVDEMHFMTKNAQNLLLKPFEDAPATTLWIVCTTEENKIIPTLRRRCVSYRLKTLTPSGVGEYLASAGKAYGISTDTSALAEAAVSADIYSPGFLLMALEKLATGMSPKDALAGLGGETSPESLRICKALIKGEWIGMAKELKATKPEEARLLRGATCGWLRACLFNERNPKKQDAIAMSIAELSSGTAPLDDAALYNWITANLYRAARRIKAAGV
jgi:DNA polymerase-3 subunit gamma/tau